MQVNNISNINLDKIQHLVEENGSIVLILDLDTRIRLFSRFSYANEHIENILKTITNFDNITILITGSESAVLEYKHILESKKIFREKILIKPFNNLQLNQFISYNLTH
ncbi:hypothetical protein VYA_14950 [Vibrio alfacsensis]|nr:hypothetical protein VYA_14950 [Vibrio alfacsensis]